MADNFIILVPEAPGHVPTDDQQAAAGKRMRELAPDASEITTETFDTVQFFDCGKNFKSATCPHCKTEIPQEWWEDQMEADYNDGFKLASYDTPCCGKGTNLNQLVYDQPQGFSRFAVSATNPGIERLSDQQRAEFEAILGAKFRVVYSRL